jgi:hypothetical protein
LWREFTIPETRWSLSICQTEWGPQTTDAADALDGVLHIRCLLMGIGPVCLRVRIVVTKTPQKELARCRCQRLPRAFRGILPWLVLAVVVHGRHASVLEDLHNRARIEHVLIVGVQLHPRWVLECVEAELQVVRKVGLHLEELEVYASLLSHEDDEASDILVVAMC